MICASCQRTNRDGARFCGGCGASLASRCTACGAQYEAGARFCDECGAPLEASRAPMEKAIARKVVTVVFADLIGSVALHERLEPEAARRAVDRYHRAMTTAVEVHGGKVIQLLGDGVLAAFGVPRVAEDDAIRAVRAGVDMQRAFRELARADADELEGVGLRVALNTGEVVVSDDETAVMGDPTNVAARLQGEARDGEVILGESTKRLVADQVTLAPLGTFTLRGRKEAVPAYRVVSLDRPARTHAAAFVGRDDELRRLGFAHDIAISTRSARLVVLLGSPGIGKSRLLAEFLRRAEQRATVLFARCDAARGATFAPIAEALRASLHIEDSASREVGRAAIDAVLVGDDAERARISEGIVALLSGAPSPPEETFFVVRRFLATLAGARPVVLAIDDLHWAEPLLLDLVEHLVQWSADVPLLLVAAARPELRDARASLARTGAGIEDVISLAGLNASAATQLAANAIGASELPAALAGRVLAVSEGNPLFVGELVRMLVHDGTLQREGERWVTTTDFAALEMPPTIQVLLAARIEGLRAEERTVLERAAVVGRHFSREAVARLLAPRDAADLDARIEALRRSELIEPATGWFLGEPGLRFHHMLIRDAAYRRLLKNTRADLHEKFADWVVSRAAGSEEHDETIGWHLEQAHSNLREIGTLDARGLTLGARAAEKLGAAGRRALARDDLALAAGLLRRALTCLEPGDPARVDLALECCEATLSAGEVAAATQAIADLGAFVGTSERLRAWYVCFRGQLVALTDPQSLRESAVEVAAAAATLASAGDVAGEAKAHSVHAATLARLGQIGACEAALDRALAAARRAHDRRRANAVNAGAPLAALWGPSPITRASGRCLDVVRVLRITQGAPAVEAVALRCQAVLEALRGRGEAARRMLASARRTVEELGLAPQLLENDVFAGHVALLEGDATAAESTLRQAFDGLRARRLGADAARAAALLGRALLALDRPIEAEAFSRESEALGGDDLRASIAWRGVRAEALAQRGEHEQALAFARAAVEIAERTDVLLDHADARVALARVLRAFGREAEARAEMQQALALWDAKGATLLVERAGGTTDASSTVDAAIQRARSSGSMAVGTTSSALPARVVQNRATAAVARLDTAVEAQDLYAIADVYSDDVELIHHPTGTRSRKESAVATMERAIAAERFRFAHEPFAALGDSIALCRTTYSMRHIRLDADADFEFGEAALEELVLIESDPVGRIARIESFPVTELPRAVSRLYARYAELAPEGTDPEVARVVAETVDVLCSFDPAQFPTVVAHDIAYRDHRALGFPPLDGRDAVLRWRDTLGEHDATFDVEEVIGARPEALLARWVNRGQAIAGGGAFEREFLSLQYFGRSGRLERWEHFDVPRAADALARFEELTATVVPLRGGTGEQEGTRRLVRTNDATRAAMRVEVKATAQDLTALGEEFGNLSEIIEHSTGAVLHTAHLGAWRRMFSAREARIRVEPLAALGESLAIARSSMQIRGVAPPSSEEPFDVGDVSREEIVLVETNEAGKQTRLEFFAPEHLSEALVRLYARSAELEPAITRERAEAVARAVAAVLAMNDLGAVERCLAPDVAFADHRPLGLGATRGAARYARGLRSMYDDARPVAPSTHDVLTANEWVLLCDRGVRGTLNAGGGAFEIRSFMLWVFGADGRITHVEMFDHDQQGEALARAKAITTPPRNSRVALLPASTARENAAWRAQIAFERAWRERRWQDIVAGYAPDLEFDDRRALVGIPLSGTRFLENVRYLFDAADGRWESELLATSGEARILMRVRFVAGSTKGAPIEVEHLSITERDSAGRARSITIFDLTDDEAAFAEFLRGASPV